MQKNFNNQKSKLTEKDIEEIVDIVGHRCHAKTKRRLRSILTYGGGGIPLCGILNRLILDDNGWQYCAGQSYPDEIRTIKGIILNG